MLRSLKYGSIATLAIAVTTVFAPVQRASAKDIVETAVSAGSFNTLAAALKAGDLVAPLQGKGPFTVFAPTDDAFAQLPEETVATLLKPENKAQLVAILKYHVVAGRVAASDVVKLKAAETLNGQQVDIKVADGKVAIDQANVVQADIICDNGIIHVIDKVILPEDKTIAAIAEGAGTFGTLLAAAEAAGLTEPLAAEGSLTVFAPTDDAFAKLPKGTVASLLKPENRGKLAAILKYHVVDGRVYAAGALKSGSIETLQGDKVSIKTEGAAAFVNGARLIKTDIDASNGVIHVIDAVLLPPEKQSAVPPRKMIEEAIAHGAPLYNSGQPAACAKVYMSTANELISHHEGTFCSATMGHLRSAVAQAEQTSCDHTRAWTMRRALDVAYRNAP